LADFVVAISELRHSAMLRATRAGYSGKSVTHAELAQDRIWWRVRSGAMSKKSPRGH
jgi:hypothetical protein